MGKLSSVCGVSLLAAAVFWAAPAFAQEGPGGVINPGRDCQTITTCQYKKGGSFRGCISSYSCRVCTFVTAPCKIAGARGKVCRTSRCTWGG